MREAEILLGLIKKHLAAADAIVACVEPAFVFEIKEAHPSRPVRRNLLGKKPAAALDIEKATAALPIPVVQEIKKSRVVVTRELDQLILDTWKNGSVHIGDVAKRLNASFSTVRNRLIELGAFKPKPIMSEKDRATVVKLFDERQSLEEIGRSLSPPRSTTHIKRLLQQAGRVPKKQYDGFAARRDRAVRNG